MAVTFSFEPEGYLRFVMVGDWSDAETSRATRANLGASGHWHADTRVLVDLRQAAGTTAPRFDELRDRMASWMAMPALPARVAVLAAAGLTYGLGRVLEGLAAPHGARLRIFEDEVAAVRWLLTPGVPGEVP